MIQSRDGRTRGVQSCMLALLSSLLTSPLHAAPIESSQVEAGAQSSPAPAIECVAPANPQPAPPWHGDLWTRTQLTGDWAGARDPFAEHGATFFGDITQYHQGVVAGGLEQEFKYGGRGDYLVDIDLQKAGIWEGGHFDLRGESRLGEDCNGIDGAVAPSNFAMKLPLPGQNVSALTGVQFTQDFSDNLSVFCGKLNLLDGTPASYARGMRLNYFWNAAMQSNLSRSYLIPSTLGAGFTVRNEDEQVFNFHLLDTHYTPTTSGFSTLFSNGVVAYGELRLRTNWFDLPGHSAVGFLYSTATRTSLDSDPYLFLGAILSGGPLPAKDTAWTAIYRCDQALWVDAKDPKRNWTLNSDIGITDGNPNPIRWFANLSLVGNNPLRGRQDDTIGIGYYHLGISDLPLLTIHGLGGEDGVELFYNAAVTPWFHVTPDVQVLDPAQRHNATSLLVGVRGRLSF